MQVFYKRQNYPIRTLKLPYRHLDLTNETDQMFVLTKCAEHDINNPPVFHYQKSEYVGAYNYGVWLSVYASNDENAERLFSGTVFAKHVPEYHAVLD